MKQQLQMQQLESEIARLQVELVQVRQMIGSLIRHEQSTFQMAYPQHTHQGSNMGQGQAQGQQQQQQLPNQFIQDEMRMAPQYQQMQNLGNQLDNQLHQLTQAMNQNNAGGTMSRDAQQMNPLNNDPMQRQF